MHGSISAAWIDHNGHPGHDLDVAQPRRLFLSPHSVTLMLQETLPECLGERFARPFIHCFPMRALRA